MIEKIAKSWYNRPNYIVFDNLSEFEFYKRWLWDESEESVIYYPDFPDKSGDFSFERPIEFDEDEEDLKKEFKADIKKCYGWCDEAIDRQVESGFFEITPTAIFYRE